MNRSLLLALAMLFLLPGSNPKISKDAVVGYNSITANDLRAHLTFLASDELEGRETTFRGQKVAAQYIASVFQRVGLKPVGDSGTFFQHFGVEVSKPNDQSTITVATKRGPATYRFGKDFFATATRDTVISGSVVFVGYLNADTSLVSLASGKIAVAFPPPRNPNDSTQRRQRFGPQPLANALATLLVNDESTTGTIEQQTTRLLAALDKGPMRLAGGAPRTGRQLFIRAPMATVSTQFANELLKSSKQTVDNMRQQLTAGTWKAALAIDSLTVTLDIRVVRELRQSENVTGYLEGSDPVLKNELVVFSAHYDHLGVGADGAIYHGADDDGSGTSTILELAEAFATNPKKPKRSILFMTVAGEEKGLLGSEYYVTHPIFPLEKTVADLNIDMIGRVDKKHEDMKQEDYTYVIGSDKISTQMDAMLKAANKESENLSLDYQYNDDNDPNQFYRRSDHYNFAKNGVPITFFFTGVHADYHRPTDTVDKILFERMAKVGRLVFTLGWKTANMPKPFVKDGKPSVYQ